MQLIFKDADGSQIKNIKIKRSDIIPAPSAVATTSQGRFVTWYYYKNDENKKLDLGLKAGYNFNFDDFEDGENVDIYPKHEKNVLVNFHDSNGLVKESQEVDIDLGQEVGIDGDNIPNVLYGLWQKNL